MRRLASLVGVALALGMLGACETTTTPTPPDSSGGASDDISYARDIQTLTSSQTCKACHGGSGVGPTLSLGTYAVDSTVNTTKLVQMLRDQGKVSDAQLAKVEAWIAAGRPVKASATAGATPGPSPTVSPTPGPSPTVSPTASPTASPTPTPSPSTPAVSYAADIQPITGSNTCNSCHQSNLGNHAVDASKDISKLQQMVQTNSGLTGSQLTAALAKLQAWGDAGKPNN